MTIQGKPTIATVLLAGIVGYWVLSGASREGKMTHDSMRMVASQLVCLSGEQMTIFQMQ